MKVSSREMEIRNYLDQLTLEYTQLCQRTDGSIYGIASGKKCLKGKPISYNPNLAKLGGKEGLRQVEVGAKDKIANLVAKAKAIGLSNKDIRQIKEEVKVELNAKKVQGKEAFKLFAKKANEMAKAKGKGNLAKTPKPKSEKVEYQRDPVSGFLVPKPYRGYDIQKDLNDPNAVAMASGSMGAVYETKGPPPGILKVGKIGQYEAEALGRLSKTGVAPEFHGVSYEGTPRRVDYGYGNHVQEISGSIAMSKMKGTALDEADFKNEAEREALNRAYIQARKAIHTNGVAHNDMHSGNAFVRDDGSVGLIDFGLAQVGYKYALIEAMGAADGYDFQYSGLTKGGWFGEDPVFNMYGKTNQTLSDNYRAAKEYMKNQFNIDWKGLEIRSTDANIALNPVNNMTDDQIKEVLDILYRGF